MPILDKGEQSQVSSEDRFLKEGEGEVDHDVPFGI